MNGNQVTGEQFDSTPCNAIPPPHIAGMLGTVPDTGTRLCPLCNSEIKLFFINFNEKMLMCENTECEFPFGYEDLQFVKEDNGFGANEEIDSIKCFKMESAVPTGSVISSCAWFDIDQINATLQMENADNQSDTASVTMERKKLRESQNQIKEQLDDLKSMALELENQMAEDADMQIKNRRWLRNLKTLQEKSGVQLLMPAEAGRLKKEEPELGLGELKININPGDSENMTSIRIEIHDHCDTAEGQNSDVAPVESVTT